MKHSNVPQLNALEVRVTNLVNMPFNYEKEDQEVADIKVKKKRKGDDQQQDHPSLRIKKESRRLSIMEALHSRKKEMKTSMAKPKAATLTRRTS
jgi:hypothetical protein